MASKEIRLKINVEGNAEQSLDNIKKSYDDIAKAAETAKKASQGVGSLPNQPAPKPATRDWAAEGEAFNEKRNVGEDRLVAMIHSGLSERSKEFQEQAKATGAMERSYQRMNAVMEYHALQYPKIAAGKEVMAGLAAGAQGYVGALSLIGVKGEDATKQIEKMMAIQSLMNGVEGVSVMLSEKSMSGVALRKAGLVSLSAAQAAYTTVVGASSGALKAFNIALLATGFGVAVVAIGAIVAATMKYIDKKKEATEAEKKHNDEIKEGLRLGHEALMQQAEKNKSSATSLLTENERLKVDKVRREQGDEAADKMVFDSLNKQLETAKTNLNSAATDAKKTLSGMKVEFDPNNFESIVKGLEKITKKDDTNSILEAYKKSYLEVENINLRMGQVKPGSKSSSNSTINKPKPETLSAVAPKTFNVYINSLGEIQEVNIMSDKDGKEFQKTLVNTLMGALTTVQAQTSR